MESRETIIGVAGLVAFSVVALLVATCKELEPTPYGRTKEKPQRTLVEEHVSSEAGATPPDLPHTVGEATLSPPKEASGAGLHLSPRGAASTDEQAAENRLTAPLGDFSTSPAFAASHERWLDMSGELYGVLELTIGELRDLDFSFWEENPRFMYLSFGADHQTVGDLVRVEDPRRALERAWEDPANRALWVEHQRLYRQQHVGSQTGADLAMTQRQLAQLRDALWSGISPAHQFLHRLAQETR